MEERLQKYMAECGVGSRRRCEEIIKEGRVKVNGATVTEMGFKVDPGKDIVEYAGKVLKNTQPATTVLLNKPAGFVTTARDQFGRPDVTQLVRMNGVRLYPVGRLDYQTTGLLLLTNDGELAYKLTHPAHQIDKVYRALVRGEIKLEAIRRLEEGVTLEEGVVTSPAKVKLLGIKGGNSTIEITIHEGRNHQVRRMAEAVGYPVLRLRRIQEGPLKLGNVKEGEYRVLSDKEVEALKKLG
ncbi:MAG: rRNA pseudouridine synthase [Lachnospiraceae bacterium]|nr:rRNA pseudouridine synthase [Lachnospiraceae bacterium]